MTKRKPAHMKFETWVDQQIREAQERGEFDNLPGKGKPIKDLHEPYDELWWIRQKLERENISYTPPNLALGKQIEDARERMAAASSEAEVRNILEVINERIREANRKPQDGPPTTVMPFDVERTVAKWHERRSASSGASEQS